MTHLTEEEVAELIAALAPAPTAWVEAAIELPRARATIDELVAGAVGDRERRAAMLADLEAALRAAGVTPRPQLVDDLRARLGASTR